MPIGAAIGSAVGGLGSAAIQSGAANSASQAAQNAEQQNLAFQNSVFSQAQSNLNPYVQTGQSANSALAGLLGTGGNPAASSTAFQNYLGSTNYNFVKNQGLQGIEYANAPSFNSGATAKALDTFNTGLAGNALSGYENLLTGQAGQGVTAASALNGVGTNIAAQNASTVNNAASVAGTAAGATGTAYSNALSNLVNQYGNNSSYVNSALSGLFNPSSTSNNAPVLT